VFAVTRLLSRWLEREDPAKAPSRLSLHSGNNGKDQPIKRRPLSLDGKSSPALILQFATIEAIMENHPQMKR
jgi:hypothetical protein